MNLLKSIGGKIACGAVALAVIAGGITWWQASPVARHEAEVFSGRTLAWLVLVIALPWLLFGVLGWAARRDSNLAGILLVGVLTLVEALLLGWLVHAVEAGDTIRAMVAAAVVASGVYNLLACDWIAERQE